MDKGEGPCNNLEFGAFVAIKITLNDERVQGDQECEMMAFYLNISLCLI